MKSRTARLALVLTILGCQAVLANAADFVVSSNSDAGTGSLREAVELLNSAGDGTHSITFQSGLGQIDLASNLPKIVGTDQMITINGAATTVSGQNSSRLFFIASGDVTIQNITLKQGMAKGGTGGDGNGGGGGGGAAGGALFVNSGANVVIQDVTLEDNSAQGGDGGDVSESGDGGGGGGGFAGNGGHARSSQGGGGGGVSADGGRASSDGGGGGGGEVDGEDSTSSTGGEGSDGAVGGTRGNAGADATIGGGGGGGGTFEGDGGNGGDGAVNGGGGGSGEEANTAGDGGMFGGGGGGGAESDGGDGGDFGGGGGAGETTSDSGNGGFLGGGAGSARGGTQGVGGFGGGDGGEAGDGGNGGDAMGGSVFVRNGGTLRIINSSLTGSDTIVGEGGSSGGGDGQALGSGAFFQTGVTLGIRVDSGIGTGVMTIADDFAGAGSLDKAGSGELILSGTNLYTGATTVTAGRLAVNGSITSDTTVTTDGELGGSGTITGNVINNGTLAAGNSIGTLTVVGGTTFNSGSTTEIEIQASASPVAGTDNDLIIADTATINGGQVTVQNATGAYTDGARYTFLQTTGGVTGVFNSIVDDLAFFDAQLGYDTNTAFFTLVDAGADFASIAEAGNCRAVGSYIDENVSTATGGFATLLDEFRELSSSEVQDGLCQLSGDVYGSGAQVMIQSTSQLIATVSNQLRSGMFAATGGTGNRSSSLARIPSPIPSEISLVSYVDESTGNATTCDALIAPTCRAAARWRGWVTGYGFGGFGESDGNAIGALQFDSFDSERTIQVGGLTRTALGNGDGWQGFAYGERGFNLKLSQSQTLQPFGGLQYIYARQNALTETGAGAMGLHMSGVDTHSLRSNLGARLRGQARKNKFGWKVTPELRGSWMHEFLDATSIVNAQFAGVGGAGFQANGLDLGRDWAVVGGGLGIQQAIQCH